MFQVYLNKPILTNQETNDNIYVKTREKYKTSIKVLDDFYFLTRIDDVNSLTKKTINDTINLVKIGDNLMPFKNFNSAITNQEQTQNNMGTYKPATIKGDIIIAYAYLDLNSIKNGKKQKTLNIFNAYVEGSKDSDIVVSKIHNILLKENDEYFLDELNKVEEGGILEIKVKANATSFSYNGRFPASFWVNPTNKDFEFNFYKKSDFEEGEQEKRHDTHHHPLEQENSPKSNSSFSSSKKEKVQYSINKDINDENIERIMKIKIEILKNIKKNGLLEEYLDEMVEVGVKEIDAETLNSIVTGVYLSIKNGHG